MHLSPTSKLGYLSFNSFTVGDVILHLWLCHCFTAGDVIFNNKQVLFLGKKTEKQ